MTLRAFGSDRLLHRRPGEIILLSPYDKGWLARKPKAGTSAEFPGTAVQSEDLYFEVVEVERAPSGRVRYLLEPWKDNNVIRLLEHYNDASEAQRFDGYQKGLVHRKQSTRIGLLALLYGHLPAHAQNEIESEYGIPAVQMTMLSTLPLFLFGAWCATKIPIPGLTKPSEQIPGAIVFAGLSMFFESAVRLRSALRGKPKGSTLGTLLYWIYRGIGHLRGPRPVEVPLPDRDLDPQEAADLRFLASRDRRFKLRLGQRLSSTSPLPVSRSQQLRDLYHSREPFLALLSPPEQKLLADVFGFDYLTWGRTSVYWLMAFAVAGLASSIFSTLLGAFAVRRLLSAMLAGALLLEQISRLRQVDRGLPAGSVLALAVRPLARELLAANSSDLQEPPIHEIDIAGPDLES